MSTIEDDFLSILSRHKSLDLSTTEPYNRGGYYILKSGEIKDITGTTHDRIAVRATGIQEQETAIPLLFAETGCIRVRGFGGRFTAETYRELTPAQKNALLCFFDATPCQDENRLFFGGKEVPAEHAPVSAG